MQFTSFTFLVFFPVVCAVYYLIPSGAAASFLPAQLRRMWLLLASMFFYLWWSVRYGVFLIFSILLTYGVGICLQRVKGKAARRWLLAGGIAANMGFLLFFKYYNFAAQTAGTLLGWLNAANPFPLFDVTLPIGISFYTFQTVGYMIDVYRRQCNAQKDPVQYALFAAFFPQTLAGPIGRAPALLPQIASPARLNYEDVRAGLLQIGWGFFEKLVIADRLAIFVNTVLDGGQECESAVLLAALLLYSVQIYCDFASYSSIAIGAARVLGIKLEQNFMLPYFAKNIPEFWRRWHITLGAWFKDYLFYPLLRSKAAKRLNRAAAGKMPRYYAQNMAAIPALITVWLATGLWHGANWNYIAWGAYHGLLLILGVLLAPAVKRINAKIPRITAAKGFACLRVARTFTLVCVGYAFFRMPTVFGAWALLGKIAAGPRLSALADGTLLAFGLDMPDFWVAVAAMAVLFCVNLLQRRMDIAAKLAGLRLPLRWGVYLAGIAAVAVFGIYGPQYDSTPFIYYNF